MLIKNWRPISLINVDIKIASKALVFSLRKVIHKVIRYDQTAYVKGRYTGESVRLIDDLLAYAESENLIHSAEFQGWITDMGIDGPTFVPKRGYFLLIWVKVCPQKLAFS